MRWLHIYVSMFGLAAVLFFSVTGITLNHPDWFFGEAERQVQAEGQMSTRSGCSRDVPAARLAAGESRSVAAGREAGGRRAPAEGPRRSAGPWPTSGSTSTECTVTFKGPGYAADAFIDRESGHYNLTQTYHGFVAVINDLHKGRDTGPVWSVVIDISAVVLTVISLTGLILLFYLKLRRRPGAGRQPGRHGRHRGDLPALGAVRAMPRTAVVLDEMRSGVPDV